MLPMQPSPMFLGGGDKPAVCNYIGYSQTGNSVSPTTYSGLPIGPVFAGRYIIVHFTTYRNAAVTATSCTIGGITATKLFEFVGGGQANRAYNAFFGAYVPSGTTATVVVSHSLTASTGIAVYSVENLKSTTPVDTAGHNPASGTVLTTTVNYEKGGFILSAVSTAANTSWTWSGGSSPVEAFDEKWNSGLWSFSGAVAAPVADGSYTITATSGLAVGSTMATLSMR